MKNTRKHRQVIEDTSSITRTFSVTRRGFDDAWTEVYLDGATGECFKCTSTTQIIHRCIGLRYNIYQARVPTIVHAATLSYFTVFIIVSYNPNIIWDQFQVNLYVVVDRADVDPLPLHSELLRRR